MKYFPSNRTSEVTKQLSQICDRTIAENNRKSQN
jgi:hypothetical protein